MFRGGVKMMKWLFYKKENKTKAKVILEYNITPPEELLKEDYVEIEEKKDRKSVV